MVGGCEKLKRIFPLYPIRTCQLNLFITWLIEGFIFFLDSVYQYSRFWYLLFFHTISYQPHKASLNILLQLQFLFCFFLLAFAAVFTLFLKLQVHVLTVCFSLFLNLQEVKLNIGLVSQKGSHAGSKRVKQVPKLTSFWGNSFGLFLKGNCS